MRNPVLRFAAVASALFSALLMLGAAPASAATCSTIDGAGYLKMDGSCSCDFKFLTNQYVPYACLCRYKVGAPGIAASCIGEPYFGGNLCAADAGTDSDSSAPFGATVNVYNKCKSLCEATSNATIFGVVKGRSKDLPLQPIQQGGKTLLYPAKGSWCTFDPTGTCKEPIMNADSENCAWLYCKYPATHATEACRGQTFLLKRTYWPSDPSYYCRAAGMDGGEAPRKRDYRCDITESSQCRKASNPQAGACRKCVCKYNSKYAVESCRGKTFLGGVATTADHCAAVCKGFGAGVDNVNNVDDVDSVCDFRDKGIDPNVDPKLDKCAAPVNQFASGCQEIGGTLATLGKGSVVGLPLPLSDISPQAVVGRVINAILGVTGSLALLMFVYGGIRWMTAAGNPESVKHAKTVLVYAVLGLVVIFSAYAVVNFLLTSLG